MRNIIIYRYSKQHVRLSYRYRYIPIIPTYTTRIRFQISLGKINGLTHYVNTRRTRQVHFIIYYCIHEAGQTCKSIASISHFYFFHYGSRYCASVGNNTLQCSFKPLCRKTTVFESRQLSSWPRAICFSVWTTDYSCVLLINWQYNPGYVIEHAALTTKDQTRSVDFTVCC